LSVGASFFRPPSGLVMSLFAELVVSLVVLLVDCFRFLVVVVWRSLPLKKESKGWQWGEKDDFLLIST
jgi:hypothetical protein